MTQRTKYSKAHSKLDAFMAKTGMTNEGKRWLIAAVDPFHDVDLDCQGIPDRIVGKSISSCVKGQITLTVDGNPQDYVFVTSNFQRGQGTSDVTLLPTYFEVTDSTTGPSVGGLTYFHCDAGGDPLNQASPGWGHGSLSSGVENMQERSRVISRGFEVHNTTPELYKGGSVTCFRQDQSVNSFGMLVGTDAPGPLKPSLERMAQKWDDKVSMAERRKIHGAEAGLLEEKRIALAEMARQAEKDPIPLTTVMAANNFVLVEPPPRNVADATLLPGSHGWEASKGCYCVATQMTPDNPPTYVGSDQPVYSTSTNGMFPWSAAQPDLPYNTDWTIGGDVDITAGTYKPKMNRVVPFNTCGAYFTGLPTGTELTVFFNEWIERFPTQTNKTLVVLAKPSACYDPKAMEAYAHIMKNMPVAMIAKANGLGDWFCDAVSSLVDWCTDSTWASSGLKFLNRAMSDHSEPQKATNQGSSSVWRGGQGGPMKVPQGNNPKPLNRPIVAQRPRVLVRPQPVLKPFVPFHKRPENIKPQQIKFVEVRQNQPQPKQVVVVRRRKQ